MFGGPGTAGDHGHTRSAGDLGVPFGHVTGALLMPNQDVPDGRVEDRVVDGQDGTAGEAEHHLHLLHLQALDQCLCSGQFHRVLPCVCVGVLVSYCWCRGAGVGVLDPGIGAGT